MSNERGQVEHSMRIHAGRCDEASTMIFKYLEVLKSNCNTVLNLKYILIL